MPFLKTKPGNNTTLLPLGDYSWTVRSNQSTVHMLYVVIDLHHSATGIPSVIVIIHFYSSASSFHYCVCSKSWWNKNDGGIGTNFLYSFFNCVKHRSSPKCSCPPLPGVTTTNYIGAVFDHLFSMKCAFTACKPLNNNFGSFITKTLLI